MPFRHLEGKAVMNAVCLGVALGFSTYAAFIGPLTAHPTVLTQPQPTAAPTPTGSYEVLVAVQDYPPGYRFNGTIAIASRRVTSATAPPDALRPTESLQGWIISREGIKRGEIITRHALLRYAPEPSASAR
jgi:hypothetical protein